MRTLANNPFLRIAHKSLACILAFCIVNIPVWALEMGDTTITQSAGSAGLTGSGNTVSVDLISNHAVLDWTKMDIGAGKAIDTLAVGGAGSYLLNRVNGSEQAVFNGVLDALGKNIFIVSPNGVIVGPNASITASAFTAAGLNISNDDFTSGIYKFVPFEGGVVGDVTNQADIIYDSVTGEGVTDQVNLLGGTVLNEGTISLPAGGVVVMTAGDRVYLGEPGGDVLIEVSGIEDGMVTNNGTVNAPGGTIVMAAGDIYSTSLGLKVFDGAGKVVQNGTLNADADTYDGGTITMLAGEEVSLTENSLTTANAVPDGLGTVRPDGGDIIISSTEIVNISPDASLSAKGNGWYDVDGNFRFDFGVDTSFSGSIQIAGKYLYLPSPDDYTDPAEFKDHIDLVGYEGGQLQSGVLTIGNNEGDITVAEGAMPVDPAANTVYEEWIEDVSLAGVHIDTLSAGDIIFEYLSPNDETAYTGLIGGAGNVSFRTQFNTGGIVMTDLTDVIGTVAGGDIFMVAGSGGITTGGIGIINEDKTGDPGQIILATVNGGDISTGGMTVESGNHEIISISSSGDILIDGGILVTANEVPDSVDKTVTADICIDAGDDITINGPIEADTHGKVEMTSTIHIDAGLDPDSNDDGEAQAGMINIDLDGGQIVAVAEESGPAPGGALDLYSEATIQIHTSAEGDDAINIINGGNRAVVVRAKVQGQSPLGDSLPAEDGTDYEQTVSVIDKNITKTQIAKINIQSAVVYGEGEYADCDNCVKPPFLPPQPEFFLVKNDSTTVDWRAGYTVEGTPFDAADLDVLLNDNGQDGGSDIPLYDAMIVIDSLITEKGGTLEWVEYQYTDGDGITHIYDGFIYTPASYDVDFQWDGTSDYATFTDSFQYRGQKGDDISLNIATVTITVQNAVPTLAGDSDSIHMNTSADFDLTPYIGDPLDAPTGTLVIDPDGTPGELTGIKTGTYGDLSYNVVEGWIPMTGSDIPTDGTLALSGDTLTYSPLDGYVSPDGEPTTFGYTVTDENINGVFELPEDESLSVTVTNTLPTFGGDLGDVHMDTPITGINLLDYANDADGDTLYVLVNGEMVALDDFISGNNIDAAEIVFNGTDWDYTPTDGYVGPESFTVLVWDGQYQYTDGVKGDKVVADGLLTVNMTNTLPNGVVTLEDASMNALNEELGVTSGDFTDDDGDDFAITDISPATDDENLGFGGDLNYNGSTDPYATGDSYDYSADPLLPGYTGEDNFDVQLWDGQYDYVKVDEGPAPQGYEFFSEGDGYTVYRAKVYGTGIIDLEVTNELPGGDGWFGQVHMDSQDVSTEDLASAFGDGVSVENGTYTGSVIGSDNYGGTLEYDGTTWTYNTDTDLPGYVGDNNDEYGQSGYVADDLFTVNLSGELGDQYDYWFSEGPAPDGYEYYEPAGLYRKAEFGTGTLSVDITNELPTIDETTTIEHMNESIENQVFATDHLDGNPINELDALSISDTTNPGFGDLTLIDNGDGTYSYTYEPAEGFVGNDSFKITVYDGQRDYVFVDGEIQSNSPVPVEGTVNMKITNIIPSAAGDLGEVTPGNSTPQSGVTSPVLVTDPLDAPQQDILDHLSIVKGIYTLPSGSTLEFTGSEWIYTPASGAPEQETFTINVWDGQYDYTNVEVRKPVYGEGTVQVSYTSTPPSIPAAPLPLLEIPQLKGCPAVMDAAATELAVNSDDLQLLIANSMATNPNLQPCTACENLLTAAAALKGINESSLAAMNTIFNTLAPIDAPFDQTVVASIQTAFANFREKDTQLAAMTDEEYQEYQQYAMTDEVIEAFVSYVAVLDNDLKLPVGDAMALVMDKYFESIDTSGNPNIGAYIIEQIQAAQAAGEPIVASAN